MKKLFLLGIFIFVFAGCTASLQQNKEFTIFTKECSKQKITMRELDRRARDQIKNDCPECENDRYKLESAGYYLIDNDHYIRLVYRRNFFDLYRVIFFDINGLVSLNAPAKG